MAIIATEGARFSAVVKHEYAPEVGTTREAVVINDAAATLQVGAVLGVVTATGKYKLAKSAATDGSQTPVAVLIADGNGNSGEIALKANTDTKALVLAAGPSIVAGEALQLGTGITLAAAKDALKAVGITVETAA